MAILQISYTDPAMILDPINSITSIAFYRKVAAQSLGRTVGYLFYLATLFTLVTLLAVKVRIMPQVAGVFDWLGKSVPVLTFAGGKLSSATPGPTILRHPAAQEVGVVITRLDDPSHAGGEQGVATSHQRLCIKRETGRIEVQDFSKAAPPKPVVVDADFWKTAGEMIPYFMYPAAVLFTFPLFLFWKVFATALYMIMALLINALAQAQLDAKPLLNITVYAQTFLVALEMILLLIPAPVPLALQTLASFLITGTYIGLAVRSAASAAPTAPPAAPAQ